MIVVDNRLSDEILVEWGMTFTLNFQGQILDWPRILRIASLIDMEQKKSVYKQWRSLASLTVDLLPGSSLSLSKLFLCKPTIFINWFMLRASLSN